jgi:hypothetical protein
MPLRFFADHCIANAVIQQLQNAGYEVLRLKDHLPMEPHGQSPWFPRNAHKGRTSRTRGPIHPRVEPVVLLVRDRISGQCGYYNCPEA